MSKKNWKQILYKVDMYGIKPEFRIGNYDSFHTRVGLIFTIISFLLIVSLIIKFGLDLISNKTPITTLSVTYTNDPPLYNITQDNFALRVGLTTKYYEQFLDESIYKIEMFLFVNSERIKLETIACSKVDDKFQSIFSTLQLEKFYCLKDPNFPIQGSYYSSVHSRFVVILSQCNNSTLPNSPVCKSQTEIDKILDFAYFTFSYTDISIDPTDFEEPAKYYDGNKYLSVSNNYYQNIVQNQKLATMETDSSWLFESNKKITLLQSDVFDSNTHFVKTTNLLDYTLRLSKRADVYKRRYMKLQDMAAQVGGLMKIILVVFQNLAKIFNVSKFDEFLTNQLFNLVEFNESEKNGGKNIKTIRFLNNSSLNKLNREIIPGVDFENKVAMNEIPINKIQPINYRLQNPWEISTKDVPSAIKLKSNLVINSLDSFLYIFPFCTNKSVDKLRISSNRIKEKMDIMYIFKTLNDVERIKKVLLDEDMQKLFNMDYKEDLILDSEKDEKKKETNYLNLRIVYNKIKAQSETKSKLKRLLTVLDRSNLHLIQ